MGDPSSQLALERRFPQLQGLLPRHPLTTLPTPVARLERLGAATGIDRLWVKRDDRSGRLYGGNKPRKLELVLGEALRRGRRSVLTFGGIGSHHALATTIHARAAGLAVRLVLVPQPLTDHVRRCLLLDHAFGAELHLADGVRGAALSGVRLLARDALAGQRPQLIPAGGTSVLGTVGYLNAGLELAEQVHAGELPEPEAVFVALGTGGTVAGLAAGLALGGLRARVVGVLVTDLLVPSPARLVRLGRAAARRLRRAASDIPGIALGPDRVLVERAWRGPGYGVPTPEAERARAQIADLEGIEVETTYTAKCLAALLALGREEPWRGRTLLYWNTYSSVDPGAGLAALPDPRQLPPAFHRFFEVATA